MKSENLGKKFVEVNRALTWAETPEEWTPAIQKIDAFCIVYTFCLLSTFHFSI